MMRILLFIFCFLGHVANTLQQQTLSSCQHVTPYDVVCIQKNGHTSILSSHLCDTPDSPYFSLWTVDQDQKIIIKDFRVELGTYAKENKYGLAMNVSQIVHDGDVVVNLNLANETSDNTLNFVLRKFDCYSQPQQHKKRITVLGQKLGEYSRLFIPQVKESNSNEDIPKQLYLLFFNPCSVPFSYVILTTNGQQQKQMYRYTDTKNDSFIPTTLSGRDKTQTSGLHLLVENLDRSEDHQVTLVHLTESGRSIQIIRDTFNSQLGRICPVHKCEALKDYASQRCMLKWIDYDDVIRTVRTEVTYLACSKPVLAKVALKVIGSDASLYFTDYLRLTIDGIDSIGSDKKPLQIGYPPFERQDKPGDGYLSLDTGSVSLYVKEHANVSHLMVFRHYPSDDNIFPLVNIYFNGTMKTLCPKQEGKLLPILVGVFSSLLVLVIVVAFIVVMRRRLRYFRMRDNQDDTVGLPHRIHLHDDEFNENLDEY